MSNKDGYTRKKYLTIFIVCCTVIDEIRKISQQTKHRSKLWDYCRLSYNIIKPVGSLILN